MSDLFSKYLNEFIAFMIFGALFFWVIRNGTEINTFLTGLSDVYLKTFKGLVDVGGK